MTTVKRCNYSNSINYSFSIERSQSLGGAPCEYLVPQALWGTNKRDSRSAMPEDGASRSKGPCPHRAGTKAGLKRLVSRTPRIGSNYKREGLVGIASIFNYRTYKVSHSYAGSLRFASQACSEGQIRNYKPNFLSASKQSATEPDTLILPPNTILSTSWIGMCNTSMLSDSSRSCSAIL